MSGEPLENLETLDGQLSGKAGQFEELVERLALAIRDAYSGGAEHSTESDMRRARKDVRTVLVELAKMGAEALPCDDDTAERLSDKWAREDGGENANHDEIVAVRRALQWAQKRTAPLLAAKDAELARRAEEIERLQKRERAVAAWLEYEGGRAAVLLDDPEPVERQIGAARNRAVKQLGARLNEASMPTKAPSMNITSADD